MKLMTATEKFLYNGKIKDEIRENQELYKEANGIDLFANVEGSSVKSPECPNCGPWKNHWKEFSKVPWPNKCSVSTCNEIADRGGHVVCSGDKRGRRYIVPMCKVCNGKSPDKDFALDFGTVMISANCSDTCDKFIK